MTAVFRHELSSHFTDVYAYVFGAFLLLFAGIYTLVYNLNYAYADFEYVLGSMPFIFLVAVPVLTMRVMAEERRQHTDQLLYSLPISMGSVVIGKYLAMLVVFAIPTAVIGIYPLILRAFGSVPLGTVYATLLGFFFLGAVLIAIGMFISSVTESQAVAAGICFVVMLLLYYCTSLAGLLSSSAFTSLVGMTVLVVLLAVIIWLMTKSSTAAVIVGVVLEAVLLIVYWRTDTLFEGLFARLMEQFSVFSRFDNFVNGVFDLNCLVYYLSIIAVFLFLSMQSLEKRRWSE